ncbi:MAG: glycosyltransferase [Bacteroidales bacterium]|nr:glycosyltransferase [Bacteroidales bacterium]
MSSDIIEKKVSADTVVTGSPILSIIMPVYNMERYLAESVDSVLAQSFREWELILIDDGSTDSSPDMCDKYASLDSRVRVIHQKNAGQGVARNNGLSIAHGRYIGFVDSDDWIDPDMFSVMIKGLEQENCDMAVCGYYLDFIGRSKIKEPRAMTGVYDGATLMKEGYLDRVVQSIACDKIFRREIVEQGFSGRRYFEDHAVMLHWFSKVNRWISISSPKYHYRMRRSGVTNGFSADKRMAKFYADIERAEFMLRLPIEKHGLSEAEIAAPVIISAVGTAKAIARNTTDADEAMKFIEEITGLSEKYLEAASAIIPVKILRRYRMMCSSPGKFRRNMRVANLFAFGSHRRENSMYD